MALAFETRRTPLALWSRRVALLALQLALAAVVLHRFAGLPTPLMLNLVKAALAGALLAILLALGALALVWRRGHVGAGAALGAMTLAGGLIAWPVAAFVPPMLKLPPLTDVSTDTESPPRFEALAKLRGLGANAAAYPGGHLARAQTEFHPDLKTMVVTRGVVESFDLTREIVRRAKWSIVGERIPSRDNPVGIIEAEAMTTVMGYRDDVVIRLRGERDRTRIDVRSASRFGNHDLGRNAARVRELMAELHIRLDLGVPLEPETIAMRRKLRQKMLQGRAQVTGAPLPTKPGQAQPGAQREPGKTAVPRSRAEGRDRGKRSRQSWE
jgi:hypothetical protein